MILFTSYGEIPYTLIRSPKRRSLCVRIDEAGNVKAAAPLKMAQSFIESFLCKKQDWIFRKSQEAKHRYETVRAKAFDHGQEFLFLGRKHRLEISGNSSSRTKLTFNGERWIVDIPCGLTEEEKRFCIRNELVSWYRGQAEEMLGARTFYFARIMGEEPLKVAVRTQKRLWGSCHSGTKSIHLNWQIILSPLSVVDYVIVHELCHLKVPNHSRKFWNMVAKFVPDYKNREKWLKDNTAEMRLPL